MALYMEYVKDDFVEPTAVDTNGNSATPSTLVGDIDMGKTTMEGFQNSLGGDLGIDAKGLFASVENPVSP